jgi:TctA family transporter
MKKITLMKNLVLYSGILIGHVTPVWAATNGREDNSDLFVWMFLGFCALIVVAQLIPATMVLFGLVKGVKKEKAAVAPVSLHPD